MKRVASLNLTPASDGGVILSISSHAVRHAIHASIVGPDSSERALFRDWRGALDCCVKRSPIGGMRCADGSMGGQKRPS